MKSLESAQRAPQNAYQMTTSIMQDTPCPVIPLKLARSRGAERGAERNEGEADSSRDVSQRRGSPQAYAKEKRLTEGEGKEKHWGGGRTGCVGGR